MDRKLTSQDIARLAGVSQTAVSLVLRGRWQGRVGQDTAARILRIAEEKNYRVNRAASLLKTGKTNTIAVVVPDSENPFFSRILHALRVRTLNYLAPRTRNHVSCFTDSRLGYNSSSDGVSRGS